MYRRTGLSASLIAVAILMLFLVTPVQATPELEHIDGLDSWVSDIGMSGDGEWISWLDSSPNEITMHNLTSGVQTTLNINTTTGDIDLGFANDAYLDLSNDGSIIAVMADGPSGSPAAEIPLVLSSSGAEIARVNGTYFGDIAMFRYDIFIDASGRYIIFGTDANYLKSVLTGTPAYTLTPSGNLETVYRLDTQTGILEMVAIRAGGGELNDYAYVSGISDGGRYVLFESYATDLPGANGDRRLYMRDMNSTDASSIILVSVDENGTPITSLECCSTVPDISDDGSRVVYTENSSSSSDGNSHTFLWTRDTGSSNLAGTAIELTSVEGRKDINISGNGHWLGADFEVFSRLEIDTGITDPLPDANGSPAELDDLKISTNGEVIVFWNNDLTKPVGEDGRWWALRYAAGPPPDTTDPQWPGGATLDLVQGSNNVQINWPEASDDTAVTQYAVYRDDVEIAMINAPTRTHTDPYDVSGTFVYTIEAMDAAGNESGDGPTAEITVDYLPAILISISETILVSDDATTLLGIDIAINEIILISDESIALPSIDITILETISVSDNGIALPPLNISVSETITVSDDITIFVHPTLLDTINLGLPDGPLVPGSVFTADAGGFKPFTPVLAFLQSEPVLVGTETADADGNVSFLINVPEDFPPGDHLLVLLGQSPDGSERRLNAELTIEPLDLIFQNGYE